MNEFISKHTDMLVISGLILTWITIQVSLYSGLRTDLQATNTRIDHLADNMSLMQIDLGQRLTVVETKLDAITVVPSDSE